MSNKLLVSVLKEEKKLVLVPAAVLAGLGLLLGLFFVPKVRETLKLRQEIKRQEVAVNKLQQKLADLKSISEPELYEMASLLLLAVPTKNSYFQNLSLVKRLGSETGLTISSFNLSPGVVSTEAAAAKSKKETGPESITLQVNYLASSESLIEFISKLETALPLHRVAQLKFDSFDSSAAASQVPLSGVMIIESHASPLPAYLGKVDSPVVRVGQREQRLVEELKKYVSYPEVGLSVSPSVVGRDNPFPF